METQRKTMVLVFAGPNGSGKSTITSMIEPVGVYINADDIKKATGCTDLEAAQLAEKKRNECIANDEDFTFETVLSTERNLNLLKKAKENGYFIKSVFVLTDSPQTNISRVMSRVATGGHDVPKDKIISRYERSLKILPELIKVSDICNVYDNTFTPFRIFSKKKGLFRLWENECWNKERIISLTNHREYARINDKPVSDFYIMELSNQEFQALKNAQIPMQRCKTPGKNDAIIVRFDKSLKERAVEIIKGTSKQSIKQPPKRKT